MPNINDRIGSQNVIRVLSNASAPPTRLINLTDVDSTIRDDGVILVWDLGTEKFITTSVIDSAIFGASSLVSFTNTTDSSLITNGALVISGGVGIGKNLNIGGGVSITGLSTFASNLDINASVDILSNLDVGGNIVITGLSTFASNLDINAAVDILTTLDVTGKITGSGLFESKGTTTLASNGGITTTGGDLYVDDDLYVGRNVNVVGASTFIGNVTFKGGTIGIGDSTGDDIDIGGEFISNLVPNDDNTYDIGISTQRWRTGRFSGLVTTTDLYVSGISTLGVTTLTDVTAQQLNVSGISTLGITTATDLTVQQLNVSGISTLGVTTLTDVTAQQLYISGLSTFKNNVSITGFVTVTEGLYYDSDNYTGPNGIAYFDDTGKLIGAAATTTGITTSNFILTTDAVGIPTWTSVIDGGWYWWLNQALDKD